MNKLLPLSKAGKEHQKYLKHLTTRPSQIKVIEKGLIDWKDDAWKWAGAFAEKYALCLIMDYSLHCDPMIEIAAKTMTYVKYNIFQFPSSIRNKYQKDLIMKYDDKLCSRTELTIPELEQWTNEFKKLNLFDYYKMEAKQAEEFTTLMSEPHVSKETPIKFYICGNDDCSYTQVYANKEESLEALEMILQFPTWKMLKLLGFQFTN